MPGDVCHAIQGSLAAFLLSPVVSALGPLPRPSFPPLQVGEDCPAPTRALGWSLKEDMNISWPLTDSCRGPVVGLAPTAS